MCGIAGIVLNDSSASVDLKGVLEKMQCTLSHRGPDDTGIFAAPSGRVGLGHTRLSILDLSIAGHQPMQDRATGNWISYNGEIYNYLRLREELGAKGEEHGARSRKSRGMAVGDGY